MVLGAAAFVDATQLWVPTYGYVLRSPSFEIEEMAPWKAFSIGSGSDPSLTVFVQALDELSKTWTDFHSFEQLAPGWSGLPMLNGLSHWIKSHAPTPTVGHHLYLCVVTQTQVHTMSTDISQTTGKSEDKMPPIATNLAEFSKLMSDYGFADVDAIA